MALYLDKDVKCTCGNGHLLEGLYLVSYCEVVEEGLSEIII